MNSYLTAVKVDSSREIGKEDQILNTTDISMSLLFFPLLATPSLNSMCQKWALRHRERKL